MIDFVEIEKIVPNEGTLTLTFKKTKDRLIVCYAPRYKSKEEDKDFRPVTVTGTPEELNAEWNEKIKEIAKNERLLISTSASANLSTRKQETEKALVEKSKSKTKGKTSPSSDDSNHSLFSSAKKKKADAKKEDTAPEPEKKDEPDNTSSAEPTETKTEAAVGQDNSETESDAAETGKEEPASVESCESTQPVSIF